MRPRDVHRAFATALEPAGAAWVCRTVPCAIGDPRELEVLDEGLWSRAELFVTSHLVRFPRTARIRGRWWRLTIAENDAEPSDLASADVLGAFDVPEAIEAPGHATGRRAFFAALDAEATCVDPTTLTGFDQLQHVVSELRQGTHLPRSLLPFGSQCGALTGADMLQLAARGVVHGGEARGEALERRPGSSGVCHEDSRELASSTAGATWWTGVALPHRDLEWWTHSWVVDRHGVLLETLEPQALYLGLPATDLPSFREREQRRGPAAHGLLGHSVTLGL